MSKAMTDITQPKSTAKLAVLLVTNAHCAGFPPESEEFSTSLPSLRHLQHFLVFLSSLLQDRNASVNINCP